MLLQWMGKGSPRPKKAWMSRSKIKVLLVVFFDWKVIVHHEFVLRGQMVNKTFVPGSFSMFEGCCVQAWILHHDNVPAHVSLLIHSYLAKQTSLVPHAPYSPELVTADFFLFPKLKTAFK